MLAAVWLVEGIGFERTGIVAIGSVGGDGFLDRSLDSSSSSSENTESDAKL